MGWQSSLFFPGRKLHENSMLQRRKERNIFVASSPQKLAILQKFLDPVSNNLYQFIRIVAVVDDGLDCLLIVLFEEFVCLCLEFSTSSRSILEDLEQI